MHEVLQYIYIFDYFYYSKYLNEQYGELHKYMHHMHNF